MVAGLHGGQAGRGQSRRLLVCSSVEKVNVPATRKRPGTGQPKQVIAMSDSNPIEVVLENHFAMIPEWVMYADISKSSVMVYLVLHRYANSKTGKCFPSRETIIDKARISKNTLDKSLKELVAIEAISISKRRVGPGLYASNLYTVKMHPPRNRTPKIESDIDHGDPIIGTDGGTLIGSDQYPETIPLTREVNQSQRTRTKSVKVSGDPNFDAFYKAFPRKVDPNAALAAWKKAIKIVAPEVLIEAAERYAIERKDQNPKYTKYPATWLNKGAWANEPDPEFVERKPLTAREQTVEIIRQAKERMDNKELGS